MKSIIISIHPQHVANIFSGKKSIEIRKSAPSEVPFRAIVYETKSNGGCGMVVGEFLVENYDSTDFSLGSHSRELAEKACITTKELYDYGYAKGVCAWNISAYIRYGNIVPLSKYGLKRPPQSWQYVKECR